MAPLSPDDVRLLDLLMQGRTNKQIAAATGRPLHEIKNHVKRLLSQLTLANRTAVACWWFEQLRKKKAQAILDSFRKVS